MAADRMGAHAEILGGGPAAWATAIGLVQRDWTVTVRALRGKRASRIELLAGSAVRWLSCLGVDTDAFAAVAQPCPGTWSCWGSEQADCTDAVSALYGSAWSVDRAPLDALLRKRALELGAMEAAAAPAIPKSGQARYWQVLACGAASARAGAGAHDDRLIAFTLCGVLHSNSTETDARLLIEALPEGWAYGLLGPNRTAGVGFVTDAQTVTGYDAKYVALAALRCSHRISRLLNALAHPVRLASAPIPCRWRPVRAGDYIVRVGDAQASYDPIAGRGLWEALCMTEQVTAAMHRGGNGLQDLEEVSRDVYRDYLTQRAAFYLAGAQRFGTPFWARRLGLSKTF